MSQHRQHAAPGVVDDEGEAFARAVFCRFLRQATICRDIDDVIEHMHIVNDDSRTFDIRLGGEARIPVSRELILALALKKKELLALCESTLRQSRVHAAVSAAPAVPVGGSPGGGGGGVGVGVDGGGGGGGGAGSLPDQQQQQQQQQQQHQHQQQQQQQQQQTYLPAAVVFPPPTALQAMQPPSRAPPVSLPPSLGSAGGSAGDGGGGLPGNGALASPTPASTPALASMAAAPAPTPVVFVGQQDEASAEISGGARHGDESAPSPVGAAAEPPPCQAQPPWSASNPAISAPATKQAPVVPALAPARGRGSSIRSSDGPTTIFVRKVDLKVEKEELIRHFQTFGEVVAVSMNPTRGYAFVDYPSHDCVLRAVRAPRHTVCHKILEVEIKKEPVPRRLARRLP